VTAEHRPCVEVAEPAEQLADVGDELGAQRPRRFQISAESVAWLSV
jgi:hypothetical protein